MHHNQQQEPKNEGSSQAQQAEPAMATNPNLRANENLEAAPFRPDKPEEDRPAAGSEITDGEAG